MKRILSLVLSAAMILCCAMAFAEDAAFAAGTYSASADGRNGKVSVEVTFSDHAIESIVVCEHQETDGIADAAIDAVPQAIVANQTLAVDAVAGATITSDAIVSAVTDALVMAGGNPDDWQTVVDKVLSTEVIDVDTQVAVVGAGAAGMTSAIALAQKGYQVLLLEKMSFVGGATATCGGGVTAAATQELIDLGVHDDPEVLAGYIAANGHNMNDPELTDIFAYQIGPALDYLKGLGVGMTYFDGVSAYTRDEYGLYNMTGGGAGFSATLNDIIGSTKEITLMLSTEAKELVTDDQGNVIGVTAVAADGTTYHIMADAVVLSTGTYSGSKEIVDSNYFENTINGAPVYLTGDGITMAEAVGAATNHLEWVEGRPNGIMTGEFSGTSLNNQSAITSTTGSILVNQYGVRVVNEEAVTADVYAEQDNKCLYLAMNQNGFELFCEKGGLQGWSQKYLYDAETIGEWLDADSVYPLLVKGSTPEEAAAAAGIDASAFAATVESYNRMAAAGEDTEFGHAITEAIEGDIYILELHVTHSKVLGGLKANGSLQIVDQDGAAIGNLYGAGEVVSGSQGDTETGMLTWCIASGYYVAECIDTAMCAQ